jgi:hypothetical protein
MAWLRERRAFDALYVTSASGSQLWLPSLRPVWNDVKDLTIEGARDYLANTLYEKRTTAEFGGISFDARAVSFVAPLGTIAILLYLGAFIRNLTLAHVRAGEPIQDFPWIVLFSDFTSHVLTYTSIVLLPIVANVWLLAKTSTWLQVSVILVIGIVAAGGFVVANILQLRKGIAAPAAVPGAGQSAVPPQPQPSASQLILPAGSNANLSTDGVPIAENDPL